MSEDATPRMGLPMLAAGQAQKEMTHNEALLLSGAVLEVGLDSAPPEPELGACWIVGVAPTRVWQGQANAVAISNAGGWHFIAPRAGLRLWAGVGSRFALFRNGEWRTGEAHGKFLSRVHR